MDATNRILCPIPDDERTPFVDVLLKFIDWQKVRIDNAEEENERLQKEINKLQKQALSEREQRPFKSIANKKIKRIPKRSKVFAPIKIQQQDPVKPENVQQLLVKNIQQLLVSIGSKNKRQFTRLHIHLDANLDFGAQRYYRHAVENISLGGLYVRGDFKQQLGDICTISLNQSELDATLEIHATCSVIRSSEQGIGLEFISMKLDDFCHLQTVLLYQADDPFVLGTEFVNNMNLELENDLILCKAFHFHRDRDVERGVG
ncbi:MAG: PilZ domain-containing protein [Candidatus Electrothrix sp. GW3-4]|uniref:PilZ domain-containing protein n=1 Tax=Candidatus Electrothrix sp. GW3-4 TaxID=3126740 RepID=UPI0030D2D227